VPEEMARPLLAEISSENVVSDQLRHVVSAGAQNQPPMGA
jgi:hypothetical protein